jgi:uncharacterized membrane protein YdjX (TVP38/TMEM64 family)
VAIVLSFWPPLGGFLLLATLTTFAPWLRAHEGLGFLTYFVLTVLLVGFSFLPTFACAIFAGWAFGFALGATTAVLALTAASIVAYALGRWIARDRVLEVVAEKPRWRAVQQALLGQNSRRTVFVVTLLRIPPASPFAIVNFVLAAARVPLWDYTLGTFLGLVPRTAAAAFAAASLEQLRFKDVTDRTTLIAGLVATILVVAVLGSYANRALRSLSAPAGCR